MSIAFCWQQGIVFIGHPTLRALATNHSVGYKQGVGLQCDFKLLLTKSSPFNHDWLTIFLDEAHETRTGGKLYMAVQAVFETGLIKVIATATPMYQNLRDLFYMILLLRTERVDTNAEQKLFQMLADYTRLRNKTRKDDVTYLTAQFNNHRINETAMSQSSTHKFGNLLAGVLKGFTADCIIRRTSRSRRNDGRRISEDLPPCTQVHIKVTLSNTELEAAAEAMGESAVREAVKDTGRGNFFLDARKETAFHGASKIATRDLHDSTFKSLEDLNACLCTKLKCTLALIQKILTAGGAQFFQEEEIGMDDLIKQDFDMGIDIDHEEFAFKKLQVQEMTSTDKILLHTEFAFLQNRIVSALKHIGIRAIAISGSSGTATSRARDLELFRTTPDILVCVISNVGATGLNIAFCNSLIIYDAGWSDIHKQQIVGRIDRRGQKKKSFVYQMAAEGTIDMLLLSNGRNKGTHLKSFLSVNRNEMIWRQLNHQADENTTWEFYEEEYGLTQPELLHLQAQGKFTGFTLPGDDKDDEKPKKAEKSKERGRRNEGATKGTKRKAATSPVQDLQGTGSSLQKPGKKAKPAKKAKKGKTDQNPQLDIAANHNAPNPLAPSGTESPAPQNDSSSPAPMIDIDLFNCEPGPEAESTESPILIDSDTEPIFSGTRGSSHVDIGLDTQEPEPDAESLKIRIKNPIVVDSDIKMVFPGTRDSSAAENKSHSGSILEKIRNEGPSGSGASREFATDYGGRAPGKTVGTSAKPQRRR